MRSTRHMLVFQDKHIPNIATLCFVLDTVQNKVLLGKKQHGHGVGKLNGFGGKAEWEDTSLIHTIRREVKEECGIDIIDPLLKAVIRFHPKLQTKELLTGYIYTCTNWEGIPSDSQEMKVEWYDLRQMPYGEMWEDDAQWVPLILEGKRGYIDLYPTEETKARMEFRALKNEEEFHVPVIEPKLL